MLNVRWKCGHVEPIESAGWKQCPSCMQKEIRDLKAKVKRLQGRQRKATELIDRALA